MSITSTERPYMRWPTRGSGAPPVMKDTLTKGLTGDQRNAYAAIQNMLKEYGLQSLASKILDFVKQGFSSDTISLELQETAEWKQRFVANEARRKAGLPVLSPREYIETERAYRQIMHAAGVPSGFYDKQDDFRRFLEADISPQEIQGRVTAAQDFINRADPREMAAMRKMYTLGDMVAFALDPKRAAPLVGKAFQAATITGQASAQGLSINRGLAEGLAGEGITREQAQQGFSLIAGEQDNANRLAAIHGTEKFTTEDLANETFRASNEVAERRKKLASAERGKFSGSSGASKGSLSRSSGGV